MEIAGEPRAAEEIAQLWAYLDNRLGGRRVRLLSPELPAGQPRLFGGVGGALREGI
jgi:hypothetical protein